MMTIVEVLEFLAEHADLIEALVEVVKSGASTDSIKAALRAVKLEVSDAAMREELGLPVLPHDTGGAV